MNISIIDIIILSESLFWFSILEFINKRRLSRSLSFVAESKKIFLIIFNKDGDMKSLGYFLLTVFHFVEITKFKNFYHLDKNQKN